MLSFFMLEVLTLIMVVVFPTCPLNGCGSPFSPLMPLSPLSPGSPVNLMPCTP